MRVHFRVIEENIIDCSSFFRRRAVKIINFAVKPRFASIEELRGDVRMPENERVNVLEFPNRRR
jgi:hypothetical protein